MQWDDPLNRIAKKNADKWKIPTDQAKELVDAYVQANAKKIREGRVVVWVNMGVFFLSYRRMLEYFLTRFGKRIENSYKRERVETRDKEWLRNFFTDKLPLRAKILTHDPLDGRAYKYRLEREKFIASGGTFKKFVHKRIQYRVDNYFNKAKKSGEISGDSSGE